MLDWLKDVRVPALWAVGAVALALSGYGYLHSTFVEAAAYQADQRGLQVQLLMRDRDALSREEFVLALKCERDRRCTNTERAYLDRLRADIRTLNERINALTQRR